MAGRGGGRAAVVRIGAEVIGETIEGIFGLASATVTAAGEAAKGIGTAVGGALEGALSPAPVTVVNNVGMAGEAAKAKVTGSGSIPTAPKKSAKPVANVKMPTEKLLVIAVNYLSSIEKTLESQLNFERTAAAQQAQAEREAAIEDTTSPTSSFKSLGEKLGGLKDNATDRASALTKAVLGTGALAGFTLLGLGEMDKAELDAMKENWDKFREQYKVIFDIVSEVKDAMGWEGLIGYYLFGLRGALFGTLYNLVEEWTGSKLAGGAAGAAGLALTTKWGRRLAARGAMAGARFLATPLGAAGAVTVGIGLAIDYGMKSTQSAAGRQMAEFIGRYGLYVEQWSENGLTPLKYGIVIPERNINDRGIPVRTLNNSSRRTDKYYYWYMVKEAYQRFIFSRSGPAIRAQAWLDSPDAQAWLDEYFPMRSDASPVPPAQAAPDATRSGSIEGAPVADATQLANLPAIPADVEKILATIRTRESGGNYGAQNPESTASGAYQFIDGTWQALTSKYGIGTEYAKAKLAPAEIQDAVAAKYVQEILNEAGGDVTKVPVAWYTGNIRGESSAVSPAQVAEYQAAWLSTYTGGRYSPSSYNLQGDNGSGEGLGAGLWEMAKGAIEAVSNIMASAAGKYTPTTGSQLTSFNTDMKSSSSASSASSAAAPITPPPDPKVSQLNSISNQIQTAVDLGNAKDSQTNMMTDVPAGQASLRSASPDGKLEAIDPNYPGTGGIEAYLQYYRLAA